MTTCEPNYYPFRAGIRLECDARDQDDNLVDLSDLTLYLRDPNGDEVAISGVTEPEAFTLSTDETRWVYKMRGSIAGKWLYSFDTGDRTEGDEGAGEKEFYVNKSGILMRRAL